MPGYGEIGTAAIRILADGSQFGSSMERSVDPVAKRTGSRFASAMGGTLKAGAVATGAAVAGVLGTALTKGFSRLTAIDDAKNKLLGLKMPAKTVELVMTNALNAVKGTAYGLGEAATIASGMVAAGIKPGKELEKTLRLVADTAGITGGSIEEIGVVWGQIAAKGRLMGDEMLQLTERGVPILSYLAKHYKITAAEASDMVSKGKVDFATFRTVMEENIGGAAVRSGKSFTGSLRNIGAALSRLGAGLLGGVFSQMPNLFGELIGWIDKITPAAQKAGEWIGKGFARAADAVRGLIALLVTGDFTESFRKAFSVEEDSPIVDTITRIRNAIIGLYNLIVKADFTPALRKAFGVEEDSPIVAMFLDLRESVEWMISGVTRALAGLDMGAWGWITGGTAAIGGLGGAIGGFLPLITKIGPMLLRGLLSPMGLVTVGIGGLVGAFATGRTSGEQFETIIGGIASQIGAFADKLPGLVTMLVSALPGILAKILPAITDVFDALGTALPQLIMALVPPLLQAGVTLFSALAKAASTVLPVVINGIVAVIKGIAATLPTLVPLLVNAFVGLLSSMVGAMLAVLPSLIDGMLALVNALIAVLPSLVPALINAAIVLLTGIVKAATLIIPALIKAGVTLITALVNYLPVLIPALLNAAVTLFTALVNALPIILPALINGAVAVINAVAKMLPTLIPMLINAAITLFMALVNSLPIILPLLVQGAIAVIFAVVKMLPTLIPTLLQAAFTLFMALVKAVPMILGALLSAFGVLLGKAWKFLTDTFESWRKGAIEWFGKIGQGIATKWGELTSWLRRPVDEALKWIQINLIDRFNSLLRGLGISWQIGRIWSGSSGSANAAEHKDGGWTGGGSPNAPAGIVHGREWVLNAKSTAALMRDYGVGFLNALNGYAAGGWVSPVVGYKPAFPWGHYPSGGIHKALDYAVPTGTPVNAPDDGRVVKAGWDSTGYGISVFLNHANGLFSVLGHMRNIIVAVGRYVAAGQRVGYSDNTGRSTGPHLHWGVMSGGIYGPGVNPGVVAAGGGLDLGKVFADFVRKVSGGLGNGLDWVSSNLGPMGKIVGGIGRKFLGFITDKALAMLGFGEGGGGRGLRAYDRGGWLRPGLTLAYNGTGKPERVLPPGGGYGPMIVYVNVSVDDLDKMSKIGDFIEMLEKARVDARRTERSGTVSA